MFRIRDEQLLVFEGYRRRDFEQRLTRFLRHCLIERGVEFDEDVLQQQIQIGLEHSANFDIITERDIAHFLEIVCTVLVGFGPAGMPADALRILEARAVPSNERLDRFATWAADYRRDVLREA